MASGKSAQQQPWGCEELLCQEFPGNFCRETVSGVLVYEKCRKLVEVAVGLQWGLLWFFFLKKQGLSCTNPVRGGSL